MLGGDRYPGALVPVVGAGAGSVRWGRNPVVAELVRGRYSELGIGVGGLVGWFRGELFRDCGRAGRRER